LTHKKTENIAQELFTKLTASYAELTDTALQEAKKYKKGSYIFEQNQVPRGVFYIKSGWVKISKIDSHGNERVLRLVSKNQFIGYLSLIKNKKFQANAVAVADCQIFFIPKQIFLKLLATNNAFASLVVEMLADEVEEKENHIANLLSKNVQERLANLLIGLEQASFHDSSQHDDSYIRLPKKELAHIINITPETLSRHLTVLVQDGLIDNNKQHIELLNKKGLLAKGNLQD
jgi:CRP-like cAMP-binding protein